MVAIWQPTAKLVKVAGEKKPRYYSGWYDVYGGGGLLGRVYGDRGDTGGVTWRIVGLRSAPGFKEAQAAADFLLRGHLVALKRRKKITELTNYEIEFSPLT